MNIKRVVSFVVVSFILVLIYQFVVIYFEKGHSIEYSVSGNNIEFKVLEKYKKTDLEDGYTITITSPDNRQYSYYVKNNFNKQKKIITEVKIYNKDSYQCLYPVTVNNAETEVLCSDGKETYSSEYTNKKINIEEFLNELNIKDKYTDSKSKTLKDGQVTIYSSNLYDNEYLEIYRYKYLLTYNKDKKNNFNFSSKDIYTNELGQYVDNYFLLPIVNVKKEVNEYYIVNVKKGDYKYITINQTLSNNLYNIGVVDGKLYGFDLKNKIEYVVNPNSGSFEVIGTVNKGFQFYEDGKWVEQSVTDFTENKIKITTTSKVDDIKFNYDQIYESDNAYYLIDNDKVYRVYKNAKEVRVLLFEENKYNNLIINKDRIYYIKDNYLYRYDQYGTKALVDNNEFKYNNTNIYYVYND